MTQQNAKFFEVDLVIEWLKSQDYRVTRPFIPRAFYCAALPPAKLLKAAILDMVLRTFGIKPSVMCGNLMVLQKRILGYFLRRVSGDLITQSQISQLKQWVQGILNELSGTVPKIKYRV
jgi:hypothetical protein